jgi:hypothetical protein
MLGGFLFSKKLLKIRRIELWELMIAKIIKGNERK